MCGRYSLSRPVDELADFFGAFTAPGLHESYEPSYNIAPTRSVVGLATTPPRRRVLELYHWGFGNRQFNTRAETVSAGAVSATRRIAMLADGFFEWQAVPEAPNRRRPLFFVRPDGAPLALAALGEAGRDRPCTMITTAAGPDLEGIHDRMPIVLDTDALEVWLHPGRLDRNELKRMLRPAPGGTLVHHAVDPRVGDVRNDGPDLVARYEPPAPPPPLRLFG